MKSQMSANTAKSILIGSLIEFVSDPRYYRYSEVGMEYSTITAVGETELKKIMELNLCLLRDSVENDRMDFAKEQMMDALR